MEQLPIPFTQDLSHVRELIERASGRAVSITVTDNSTRMVSAKGGQGEVALRLHRIFLSAPKEVLGELGRFIAGSRIKTPLVNRFIRDKRLELQGKPRNERLRPSGRCHDLAEIFGAVNREYFSGSIAASITWSRRQPGRVRRRTLGSYSFASRTVRVSAILDSPAVPRFFVEFIVYHEMLHAHLGMERKGERMSVHSREFRRKEKEFKLFQLATAWERSNRHLL
ncbi:MAG TPA: hypothetical protein DDW94_12160 [Deltaproteobacteria bacterium]|nr:MAG: hypothetical protein A2Z79_08305 [Deltaproteobacteria bacterium GWA2_55_82]OIJ73588.1 MAG: hypothetical protein A2V21_304500 [Deltaproteobacteria bacterium GWC2_55_46]HBG47722.1 hypothetical protein [Deltaproteobacteria bacterium]HCY12056.1 hypothetical protein [Deltaproteobacteria bacterium]